jgi:DNA-directed RNA polymerase omega subunit
MKEEVIIKEEKVKKYAPKIPVLCLEDLLNQIGGNVFQLVRIAANRALEIDAGKPLLIGNPTSDKVTTIALEEIVQGKVAYKNKVKSRT